MIHPPPWPCQGSPQRGRCQTCPKIPVSQKITSTPTHPNNPHRNVGQRKPWRPRGHPPPRFHPSLLAATNPQRTRGNSNNKTRRTISAQQVGRGTRRRQSRRFLFSTPLHQQEGFNVNNSPPPPSATFIPLNPPTATMWVGAKLIARFRIHPAPAKPLA